jgi:hypothetical protein
MAEVPEHLLKRAAERKAALEAQKAAAAAAAAPSSSSEGEAPALGASGLSDADVAASNAEADKTGKIPAHLLARSAEAKAKAAAGASSGGSGGGGGTATATTPAPTGGVTTAARTSGPSDATAGLVGPSVTPNGS